MKKTLLTLLTVITLSASGQTKSLVVIDVQEQINNISYKQNKAGGLLIESKKMRVEGLAWMAACTGMGVAAISLGSKLKSSTGANFFGYGFMLLGGTMSIVKMVGAFKKIEDAGKILID